MAVGNVSVVGFVQIRCAQRCSDGTRLSVTIHLATHRRAKTGCSGCCGINELLMLSLTDARQALG